MAPSDSKGHILVVEDDEGYALALDRMLTAAGFHVSVAMDFRGALEVLEADRPLDLMVSDIVMPDSVNGLALSRMARMRRRDLKLIYVTGYDVPGIEDQAMGPVLKKPVEKTRLIDEIERALAAA